MSTTDPLMEVRDLEKHFPLTRGIVLARRAGAVKAVDGVSFDVLRGETLGIVGETGCGKSTTARLMMRLLEPTAGTVRFEGEDITRLRGAQAEGGPARAADGLPGSLLLAEPAQDGRLDRRRAVRDPRPAQRSRGAPRAGDGVDGPGRVEPRALQPLPARVLRRPAPADRRRARARARPEAADRRRAGLRARRLDPGAGAEPAARAPARDGPDARADLPRPLGRAAHVRSRRGDVRGQDRRARRERGAVQRTVAPVYPGTARGGARVARRDRRRDPAPARDRRTITG